jgi:hypothetical protein
MYDIYNISIFLSRNLMQSGAKSDFLKKIRLIIKNDIRESYI